MDTKTLIHVGVEVVVIGGVVFYFQRKTAKLEGEIQILRDENTKLRQDLAKVYQILTIHDQILKGNIPQHHHKKIQPSFQTKQDDEYEENTKEKERVSEEPPEIFEEEEPDEEILDDLLKEELSVLKNPSSDFIEIECPENSNIVEKDLSKKKVQ